LFFCAAAPRKITSKNFDPDRYLSTRQAGRHPTRTGRLNHGKRAGGVHL
jgi:hypothetical protein